MEVILLERVEKLGAHRRRRQRQERLRPQLSVAQQEGASRQRDQPQAVRGQPDEIEADNADRRTEAEKAAKDVDGKSVQLIRQASNIGQLYGSVSARDIVDALETDGAKVTRSQIVLDRPIKAIGVHEVKVALHPEVAVTVKVNVARSPEEADLQAQGVDVMAQMFERDVAELAPKPTRAANAGRGRACRRSRGRSAAETCGEAAEAPAEAQPRTRATPKLRKTSRSNASLRLRSIKGQPVASDRRALFRFVAITASSPSIRRIAAPAGGTRRPACWFCWMKSDRGRRRRKRHG